MPKNGMLEEKKEHKIGGTLLIRKLKQLKNKRSMKMMKVKNIKQSFMK